MTSEEFSPSQIIFYSLEALVFGAIIVRGFFTRRKQKHITPIPSRFGFENSAPFELAYALDAEIPASSQSEIVPGVHIFFDDSPRAQILYQQLNEETASGSSVRRYLLRLIQRDSAEVKWLTLERHLKLSITETGNRIRCEIDARSNHPTRITLNILTPDKNYKAKSIEIGSHELSANFENFVMDAILSNSEFGLDDGLVLYRFFISLEVKTGLCLDFKRWDIEIY